MPSWKKVIVSGSDASLNSLNITTALTASGLNYPTADNGEESYIQTDGSGNLSFQYVKTIYEEIYNGEATSIIKGTPVYVSGSVGAASIVYRADAGDPTKMPVIYITADTINSAGTGRGIALGLIKGVDTTGYPAGTEIYLAVGGGWTSTRPTGSAIVQVLGYITKEGAGGQGVILNPGPNSIPNLTSGSVWVGNSNSIPIAVTTSSLNVLSAQTASYVNPLNQNVIITGSLLISGSVNIEEGFAYKQDSENVIRIAKSTSPVTTTYTNTIAGASAAVGTAYFDQMTAFGYQALYLSSGSDQTAFGFAAGAFNTGSSQTLVGWSAGAFNSGSNQTLIGWSAGYLGNAGNQTAVGYQSGYQNSGSSQSAFGYQAGFQNSGSNQTAIGNSAGWKNTATQQTAIGLQAGYFNIGIAQTALGQQAGQSNSGSTQTAVGYAAGFQNSGSLQVAIGAQAGRDNIGVNQTAVGYEAGRLNSGSNQSAFGYDAGYQNSGSDQVVSGYRSGYQNKGDDQTATGFEAGYLNTGIEQSAFGWRSGYQNSGANMTAVGSAAGYQNSGSGLVAVGVDAGRSNKGTLNSFFGYQAGYFTTGATVNTGSVQSVFLGASTTAGGGNRTNQIVIGYLAEGIGSNSVVLGNSSIETTALRGNIGIGTTTPTSKLDIVYSSTGVLIRGGGGTLDSTPLTLWDTGTAINNRNIIEFGHNSTYVTASRIYSTNPSPNANTGGKLVLETTSDNVGTFNTNQLVLSNNGNVGIGILTPTRRFEVVTGSTTAYFDLQNTSGPLAAVVTSDFTKLARFNASDGTNSISVGLRSSAETDNPGFGEQTDTFIYANSNANGLNIINASGTGTADYIKFFAGKVATETPSMIIIGSGSSKGNVGIGTTTPNATLDVSGSAIISGSLTATSSVVFKAYTSPTSFVGTAAGYLAFNTSGNILTVAGVPALPAGNNTEIQYNNAGALAGTSAITFDGTTLVATGSFTGSLIGELTGTASFATSASFLTPNTNAFIQNGNGFGTTAILGTTDNNALQFETNNTVKIHINSDGNVGINTITPNAKLDVNGNTIITGSFTVTGSYNSPSGNTIDSNALIQAGLLYLSNNF